MSRTTAALVALIALCGAHGAAIGEYETSIDAGSAAAIRASKPMLIEFWADWCPPCRVMDAQVYPDPAVSKAMGKVQWVRIDVDKQDSVVHRYNITGMPTIVFSDSYGNELFRYTGALDVQTMVQLLQELPGDIRSINRLSQVLAKDKDNFEALEALGRELRTAALFRSSNEYYRRAVQAHVRPDENAKRGDILVAMGRNSLDLKEASDAEQAFERYVKEFAGGPSEADAMLGLARAQILQSKRDEARRTLQTLTSRHKTGPIYNEAVRLLASL